MTANAATMSRRRMQASASAPTAMLGGFSASTARATADGARLQRLRRQYPIVKSSRPMPSATQSSLAFR